MIHWIPSKLQGADSHVMATLKQAAISGGGERSVNEGGALKQYSWGNVVVQKHSLRDAVAHFVRMAYKHAVAAGAKGGIIPLDVRDAMFKALYAKRLCQCGEMCVGGVECDMRAIEYIQKYRDAFLKRPTSFHQKMYVYSDSDKEGVTIVASSDSLPSSGDVADGVIAVIKVKRVATNY